MKQLLDIILIEDNEDHVELIKQTLQEKRVANTIVHFSKAEDAITYLRRKAGLGGKSPSVILLDLNLPGMSGHDFLGTIKADDRLMSIPVVVLTTSSGEHDREVAYQRHVNSYLVKPIDFDQFEQMVSDLGFYWGIWNDLPES